MGVSTISVTEYFASQGSRFSDSDARVIGPVLDGLYREGRSSAKDIVAEASGATSPLHKYFEWNDVAAAQLHREDQARGMARAITIRVVDNRGVDQVTRAFHPVTVAIEQDGDPTERSQKMYAPLREIQEDPIKAQQVLQAAHSALIAFMKNFRQYKEVLGERYLPIFEAIDGLGE